FTLFALAWNAGVGIFLYETVSHWRSGIIEWGGLLFLIPFVIVGMVLIGFAVRPGMLLAHPRPLITIAKAFAIGDEVRIDWVIDGPFEKLTALRIELEGREEATYRRGTRSYTDREVFHRTHVVDVVTPVPQAGTARVTVPAGSMHSFAT